MNSQEVIRELKKHDVPKNKEGMARFGIEVKYALGVSLPHIRNLAKKIGKNHKLAIELWNTKIHEARILASLIDEPNQVTEKQIEKWVKDFDSWDVCDQCCSNLFDKTRFAWDKAIEWVKRKEEFVKRAGFVMMVCLSVHDKKAEDKKFIKFLPIIKKASDDERNFVRKAVNWALRGIGKRSIALNRAAIETAKQIQKMDSKAARWIASDALRELESSAVQKRLRK